MKTEMIEVPHFPGYKCLGYVVPKKGQYHLVRKSDLDYVSFDCGCGERVVYEKLKRYVFEETGEMRRVQPGEWYITDSGHIDRWTESISTYSNYIILRKVEE